jgi:deoxyribodipyrimidine photolyase-related protein
MYVDAVDWVTAPNVVGMSQYADGGVVGTKPYVATGKYVDRMSNYCGGCRYRPGTRTGEDACPVTTFYWDFLLRHEERFRSQPRMGIAYRNLDRLDAEEKRGIRRTADGHRRRLGVSAG